MSNRFSCPNCGRHVRIEPTLTGRRVRCWECGERFVAPDPSRADARRLNLVERQAGWVGLLVVVLGIGLAWGVRLTPMPTGVKGVGAFVAVAMRIVGEVACLWGAFRGRGEAGGAIGILAGLLCLGAIAVAP